MTTVLTHWYSGFLRRRRALKHFGRHPLVEKFAGHRGESNEPVEQSDLAFMGTNVVSGSATALVVATGNRTYFGTLASKMMTDTTPNAFQAGVNSVSWQLIRFALVMVPIVLLVNGFTKGNWTEAFLFALSVAVGLTPEMLPMIVTSTLAKGAVLLSRKKVVVKRLDAIQNFGAMDVLCTHKTGTLTQDKIALARKCDVFGELATELKLKENYRKIDEIRSTSSVGACRWWCRNVMNTIS